MQPKLIIALDKLAPPEVSQIIETISQGAPEHTQDIMYKFNDMIALIGLKGIKELIGPTADIRIMLDPKWNDIPNTIRNYMVQLHASGLAENVDLVTIHANSGSATLKEAIATRDELGMNFEILAITALTSQDREDTEVIYDEDALHSVLKLTKLALDCGVDGVVCSGQETRILREVFPEANLKILNPGVRFIGGDAHDQKRVMTPKNAVERGVNYIVMGRPILQADDMVAAVEQFFSETSGVSYVPEGDYSYEKMLYTGTWKDILSYIGAFYFRPEGGKYCRFTSGLVSNAYINIGAIERHYLVIERAVSEMARQIRERDMQPDIIIGAEMGSIRISLYLAEKLGVREALYTEKDKFDMSSPKDIAGEQWYRKFGKADVIMELKRHARDLKGKKIILSEDIVSRGATIKKMTEIIQEAGAEVIAIACVGNRYEQDDQDGIPIINCFIPPKFEIYWDEKTREDVRGDFPKLPDGAIVSEKAKNEWDSLVESMRG